MSAVTGFVLAGGKSRRMGRDKALLDWHGQTLLDHLVHLVYSATERVRVVGREPLPDRIPGCGPLSGIVTALEVTDTEDNLAVAVDLPLLTPEFLRYFRSRLEASSRPLLVCKIESQFPLCLGIRRALLPARRVRLADGRLSVHEFIEAAPGEIISETELLDAGFDRRIFQNINTEEDYRAAL